MRDWRDLCLTGQFCDLPHIIGYGYKNYSKERYKKVVESGAFFIVLELSASHIGFEKKEVEASVSGFQTYV